MRQRVDSVRRPRASGFAGMGVMQFKRRGEHCLAGTSIGREGGRMRDPQLDALKGIAILAVVTSHVLATARVPANQTGPLYVALFALYLFNVQLFAFVSGFLTDRVSIRRKAVTLLVPLASWMILASALAGVGFLRAWSGIRFGIVEILTGGSSLWFLWALFVSFCIVALLERWRWVLYAVAVLVGALWWAIPWWTTARTIGPILPFVVLGIEWRRRHGEERMTTRLVVLSLCSFILLAVALFRYERVPLWVGEMTSPALLTSGLPVVAGFLACVGLLGLVRRLGDTTVLGLAVLGSASLGILGFHGLLQAVFPELFRARSLAGALFQVAALTGLSLLITAIVGRWRIPSQLLLGNRTPHLGRPPRMSDRTPQHVRSGCE